MSDVAVRRETGDIIESVITKGDLSRLTPIEKTQYYNEVCRSVGLNPFTRPFEYISLSGKLTLYARREATDQLRRINGISLEVVSRDVTGDILTVHVRAKDKNGRTDEDYGAVSIKGLAGEALANANMKAVTKGKRRVTLSISGLGFMDESEIEDIPHHERAAPADTRAQLDSFAGVQSTPMPPQAAYGPSGAGVAPEPQQVVDWETGEVLDADRLIAEASEAAGRGRAALREHLRSLTRQQREALSDQIGTADQPGALLTLARQADAEASHERLRHPMGAGVASGDTRSQGERTPQAREEAAPATDTPPSEHAAQDAPAATETPAGQPQHAQRHPPGFAANASPAGPPPPEAAPDALRPRSAIWQDVSYAVPLRDRHGGPDWDDWVRRFAHLCTEATTRQLDQLARDNATTLQRLKVSNRALYDEAIREFERERSGRPE